MTDTPAKQRILLAARQIINAENRRPTAMEVAVEAGISLRMIYYHFDGMDDVVSRALAIPPKRQLVGVTEPKEEEDG